MDLVFNINGSALYESTNGQQSFKYNMIQLSTQKHRVNPLKIELRYNKNFIDTLQTSLEKIHIPILKPFTTGSSVFQYKLTVTNIKSFLIDREQNSICTVVVTFL